MPALLAGVEAACRPRCHRSGHWPQKDFGEMLAIVDYKAGNLTSVALALHEIGQQCVITDDKDTILTAERIIFPGVGSAGTAMQKLVDLGLDGVMRTAFAKGTPIMGLCLGTQIILSYSEEQSADCLDFIAGRTVRFPADMQGPDGRRLKIPQMGWNRIAVRKEHPVLAGVDHLDEFYFVHSYYPQPADPAMVLATCEYGIEFPAAVGIKNLFAVQFHPEKSGRAGLRMLRNFCDWEG